MMMTDDTIKHQHLRDYIAIRALQGFLSCEVKYASIDQTLARDCYRLADEMLKAR